MRGSFILLVGAVAMPGVSGCDELRTITIPSESSFEVPGAVGGNPLLPDDVFPAGLLSEALAQSMEQSFNTQSVDKDAVDSLKLTKMTLTVVEPDQDGRPIRGLGFLESLTVSLGAAGVEGVVVAQSASGAFDGEPGPVFYDVPLTEAELAPALKASDSIDMTAEAVPSDPPNFATEVLFSTELTVVVNVVGALNGG